MLVAADCFLIAKEGAGRFFGKGREKWVQWRHFIGPYFFYGSLLVFYLAWRRKIFSSFLRENNWGSQAHVETASSVGLGTHIIHLAQHVWQLQLFNVESLLPYSALGMGVVLGLFGVWILSLWRQRREASGVILPVIFFGFIWYMITTIPYVIEGQVEYHLYLPAIGLCIAAACVAFPISANGHGTTSGTRVLSMILLVALAAIEMWGGDVRYQRLGKMSEQMALQLAASFRKVPAGGLTVLGPGVARWLLPVGVKGLCPFRSSRHLLTLTLPQELA